MSNTSVALWDPGFNKFQEESGSFLLDWKTTIHWNFVLAIFQLCHIYQGCWKISGPTYQCIVVPQSRMKDPKKIENYGTNLSPSFNKNQDLSSWIGEQQYTEMLDGQFSNIPDVCDIVGKLLEQHFNISFFSNPGGKILILLEILWSQYLRVQLIQKREGNE